MTRNLLVEDPAAEIRSNVQEADKADVAVDWDRLGSKASKHLNTKIPQPQLVASSSGAAGKFSSNMPSVSQRIVATASTLRTSRQAKLRIWLTPIWQIQPFQRVRAGYCRRARGEIMCVSRVPDTKWIAYLPPTKGEAARCRGEGSHGLASCISLSERSERMETKEPAQPTEIIEIDELCHLAACHVKQSP